MCPTREELRSLFSPGEPVDPARTTAVIAHARTCARCQEALRGEEEVIPVPRERLRQPGRPRFAVIVLLGCGFALFVLGRASRLSLPRARDRSVASPRS